MKTFSIVIPTICLFMAFSSCRKQEVRKISLDQLKDKIAGGWAGKMAGVSYGGPTEFDAHGFILTDSIKWKPSDVNFSLTEDDIYVQLTFMMTMDRYGVDAPAKKFQELFAKSGYKLWHANVQSRKNYFDSIFPPQSGSPEFNAHADDIDFQIEADYIGLICPGMPQSASHMAEKIGHVMNYGDGMYGGAFLAALYTEAYFENNLEKIVEKAVQSLPAESDYAKIVKDVLLLHKHYPSDWKAAWNELEKKWAGIDICGAGSPYNIDAKLNGAYIVMGLLYGDGDPLKTMEIATRCGQDSDCNPSNAMGVLGVVKGLSGFPKEIRDQVLAISDSLFINTDYSFNKAVENTMKYAKELTVKNGGTVNGNELIVYTQSPKALALEEAFPNLIFDRRIPVAEKEKWEFKGKWDSVINDKKILQSRYSSNAGDEALFTFEGTGVFLSGNWNTNCGKADVYVDGNFKRTIDNYFNYSDQHPGNTNIVVCTHLPEGKHTLRLVVRGEKRPESQGTTIYVTEAVVFKTGKKIAENCRFSFE